MGKWSQSPAASRSFPVTKFPRSVVLALLSNPQFSVIKGERDAAAKVAAEIYAKLKAAEKDLAAAEASREEAVERKAAAAAALEAAKREREDGSHAYRDNRKFSLQV